MGRSNKDSVQGRRRADGGWGGSRWAAQGRVSWRHVRVLRDRVLPQVRRELAYWRARALEEPDAQVRALALDSLSAKRFHCEGGAVFALLIPQGPLRAVWVRAMCALQTLSDVLDSLTDRPTGGRPRSQEEVFALHVPFVAAVTGLGGASGDAAGGTGTGSAAVPRYVAHLAAGAAAAVRRLPRYRAVQPLLLTLGLRYAVMQALKHGPRSRRREDLEMWARRLHAAFGARPWAEVASSAGSTLAMFRLLAWAAQPAGRDVEPPQVVLDRYSPALCAVHILLDGAVDLQEDAAADDLNVFLALASPGSSDEPLGGLFQAARRLCRTATEARRSLRGDPLGGWLTDGLFAAYLSDPKARALPARLHRVLWRGATWRGRLLALWVAWEMGRGRLGGRPAQMRTAPSLGETGSGAAKVFVRERLEATDP